MPGAPLVAGLRRQAAVAVTFCLNRPLRWVYTERERGLRRWSK